LQACNELKDLGVDVYNLSDPFFTDICVNYAVEGKDTTLKDRKRTFLSECFLL
jgi:hypothetical protein